MKNYAAIPLLFSLLASCGSSDDSPASGTGGSGGQADCPNLSGTWAFSLQCPQSGSSQNASVNQTGCNLESLWKDDKTTPQDVVTGTIDHDGNTALTIDSDGTKTQCTGSVTGSKWTSTCPADNCTLTAEKL